jgi:NADH:ubiquinone oxidoreductase subunit 3 (subunit A)
MQAIIDWGVLVQLRTVEFLTETLHIPFHLIKLAVVFSIVLWICILVLQFSKHLSRRDLFRLDLSKYEDKGPKKVMGIILYVLKYLVMFPLFTVFWGALFFFFLLIMVSEESYGNVLFFATIVIAIIRAVAYYHEGYAEELAKALPLWLLVTVLLDPHILGKVTFSINLSELLQGNTVYLSIGFIAAVEWALRALYAIRSASKGKNKEKI